MQGFKLVIAEYDGYQILKVKGHLSYSIDSTGQGKDELSESIDALLKDHFSVGIDLSEVTYIDDSVVNRLFRARDNIGLINISDEVKEKLEILGILDTFTLYDSDLEYVASFQQE